MQVGSIEVNPEIGGSMWSLGRLVPVALVFGAAAGSGELGFDVPPGYVEERRGEVVILSPAAVSDRTPCIYGIAPPIAATENLEADAESALVGAIVPGWRRLDDRHSAIRGTAAAGWPYVWYRAAFEGDVGACVLPAGNRRVDGR